MENNEKISSIIYSFREVDKFFNKQMWHHANELGVTIVQLQVLKLISKEPNLSLNELTQKMNINKSTVSSTVNRLVKASFIQREQSTSDRRAIILNLTELGREKEKEGHRLFYNRLRNLNDISDEDVKKLLALHQLVKEKIRVNGDEQN
ncbi:MarR family winged helix-turn-helix transcriptional regulator [Oceanobacillus longus]|uniref:MarR family winged helix-turn-helix transcriptional regulator n=1 Tax=Oceanobacillus longus TaxID=930120 RepID=A0ABV8GW17_9BACI